MRILIADDDEVLREELGSLLRASAHDVQLAADGDEALRLLEGRQFDVGILDVSMPGRSGIEVLQQAQRLHARTTFIVITGHGTIEAAVEAMKAGATDFIIKPFEIGALERVLQAHEERLGARSASAAGGAGTRRRKPSPRPRARPPRVDAVLLTYRDGTLIDSRVRPGQTAADHDLIGATLNVIQNFMRTSFTALRGKHLRTIVQGNCVLAIETGSYAYLISLSEGEDSPRLRTKMHELLAAFESRNRRTLENWRGDKQEAEGIEEMFGAILHATPGGLAHGSSPLPDRARGDGPIDSLPGEPGRHG